VAAQALEVMTQGVAGGEGILTGASLAALLELAAGTSVLALGPGLGRNPETARLVRQLVLQSPRPLVVDADGLNALAQQRDVLRDRAPVPMVVTPHPGEMARLTGLTVAEVQADRWGVARGFAATNDVIVVLKGERTVIAAPDGRTWINGSGNPALATAGTGDVLTGIIGGLLAQGVEPAAAAALGVFLHGAAADTLAQELGTAGMLASDLLPQIPRQRRFLSQGEGA
jgi:NAD(P)H-hydrate epimerase